MPQLEILDLGRNKLSEISDDIERMRALRVFSVEYNNIADLPLCLGNISTLRMLKLFGNPLNPGLKRIVGGNDTVLSPPPPFVNNDNERDKVSTKKVIDFLRAQAASKDSGEDSRCVLSTGAPVIT